MRIKFLAAFVLSFLVSLVTLSSVVFADQAEISVTILPGNFYVTVFGDLQSGVDLGGLTSPGIDPQVGYWSAETGVDYIQLFDATTAPGYRIQLSLDGDFIYSGTDAGQVDIPASDFVIYADWDDGGDVGLVPTLGTDDLTNTFSIDDVNSCGSAVPGAYFFDSGFGVDDYFVSFSTTPFDYFTSTVSCVNEGTLNLGRLELNMGFPSPGTYKTSLFLVMVDG